MIIDKYIIQDKNSLDISELSDLTFDLMISVYNASFRVDEVFNRINAKEKAIFSSSKYLYKDALPEHVEKIEENLSESDYILRINQVVNLEKFKEKNICIDITGFLRPDVMFLIKYLKLIGFNKVELLYAEPQKYSNREKTKFSNENVEEVSVVEGLGFSGSSSVETSKDFLIIGTGYDSKLIQFVSEDKTNANKYQIFSLPSLSLDMYQENVVRAFEAHPSVGIKPGNDTRNYFAPAYDPFETANTLKNILDDINNYHGQYTNLYLSPLGPKPQVVGFVLFYLDYLEGESAGIIFPEYTGYNVGTSKDIGRIWRYRVEFS